MFYLSSLLALTEVGILCSGLEVSEATVMFWLAVPITVFDK